MRAAAQPPSNLLTRVLSSTLRPFVYAAGISIVINLLTLTVPLYMMQIVDRVLTSQSLDTLLFLSLIALAGVATMSLLELSRSQVLVRISTWFEARLGPVVLERSVESKLAGRPYAAESLRDLAAIKDLLGGAAVLSLFDAPWVPLFLAVVFLINPWLGILAIVGTLILLLFAMLNQWLTREPLRQASKHSVKVARHVEMTLRNAEAVDAMGMMPGVTAFWIRENSQLLKLQRQASDRARVIFSGTKFVRHGVQFGILGLGAYLVIQQELTAGAMIAASIIMGRALQPVEQSIGTWKQVSEALAGYLRLKKFLDELPLRRGSTRLPRPVGNLSVEKVTFAYANQTSPIIKDMSFNVKPGEALAVIGPSAAGKSTLARLIVGSWKPSDGTVRLDGTDVSSWQRDELGRCIGYLPQDVELFSGTVGSNIARMQQVDDEEIIAAAKAAGAHEMIIRMLDGYDTEIGEFGMTLSAGQRQRIALARALFGNPHLIVLDEPNSNLDSEGEAALSKAILAAKKRSAAVVVIAHRQSILAHVDTILMVRNGVVEALGPRDDVLAKIAARRSKAVPQRGESRKNEARDNGESPGAASLSETKSTPIGKGNRASGDKIGPGLESLTDQPATIENIMARVSVIAQDAGNDLVTGRRDSKLTNSDSPNTTQLPTGSDLKIPAQEPAPRKKQQPRKKRAGPEDDRAVRPHRSEVG